MRVSSLLATKVIKLNKKHQNPFFFDINTCRKGMAKSDADERMRDMLTTVMEETQGRSDTQPVITRPTCDWSVSVIIGHLVSY